MARLTPKSGVIIDYRQFRQLRAGLTNTVLAERMETSVSNLVRIINRISTKRPVRHSTLARVAEALGETAGVLMASEAAEREANWNPPQAIEYQEGDWENRMPQDNDDEDNLREDR